MLNSLLAAMYKGRITATGFTTEDEHLIKRL